MAAAPGHLAVELEQLGCLGEETGPSPVALHLVAGGHGEQRLLPLRFGQRLAGRQDSDQAVGRGPLRAAGIDQHLLRRRPFAEPGGKGVEAAVVEMGRNLDDSGHGVTSSPRRWLDQATGTAKAGVARRQGRGVAKRGFNRLAGQQPGERGRAEDVAAPGGVECVDRWSRDQRGAH